jgi:hypothetical protein
MSFLSDLTIQNALPAGVIFPFAGSVAPAGWLLCDGTSYLRASYSRLFSSIGTAHGSNAANTFNVPDYRGRFLRGTDNMGSGAAGRDPDNAVRTAANTGGNTGNNVGSVQLNATRRNGLSATAAASSVTGSVGGSDGLHTHRANYNATTRENGTNINTGIWDGGLDAIRDDIVTNIFSGHGHGFNLTATGQTISISVGDNETRPLNAYVNYIIKI